VDLIIVPAVGVIRVVELRRECQILNLSREYCR
jgi:hypothetical protein